MRKICLLLIFGIAEVFFKLKKFDKSIKSLVYQKYPEAKAQIFEVQLRVSSQITCVKLIKK